MTTRKTRILGAIVARLLHLLYNEGRLTTGLIAVTSITWVGVNSLELKLSTITLISNCLAGLLEIILMLPYAGTPTRARIRNLLLQVLVYKCTIGCNLCVCIDLLNNVESLSEQPMRILHVLSIFRVFDGEADPRLHLGYFLL